MVGQVVSSYSPSRSLSSGAGDCPAEWMPDSEVGGEGMDAVMPFQGTWWCDSNRWWSSCSGYGLPVSTTIVDGDLDLMVGVFIGGESNW